MSHQFLFSAESHGVDETEQIGEKIAKLALSDGVSFAALYCNLGAGKTALTRGIASVLAPGTYVCSPTYAIVNEYEPKPEPSVVGHFGKEKTMPVFHFDMYRITDEDSLDSVGFYDYLARGGFIVTEWSENIEDFLPDCYYKITLEKLSDSDRRITVELIAD